MRKRVRIVFWTLVCVLLFGMLLATLADRGPGITPKNVRAIAPGMSAAEVEALLGGPPGIYDPTVSVEPTPPTKDPGKHWIGGRAAVYVCFDDAGRVTERHPLAVQPVNPASPFARLRRWLGL